MSTLIVFVGTLVILWFGLRWDLRQVPIRDERFQQIKLLAALRQLDVVQVQIKASAKNMVDAIQKAAVQIQKMQERVYEAFKKTTNEKELDKLRKKLAEGMRHDYERRQNGNNP